MKKIGRYEICGLLGRGGMGKVYKIQIPVIGKIAALKILDPHPVLIDLLGIEDLRRLFVSEAIKMAKIRHPNIAQIWNFGEADGKPFYTMDYHCNNLGMLIGETAKTEASSRVIKVDKAIYYTQQVLSGLASLHHAGIVHRDIKPFNLLLTDQDTIKICDFGLSKLRGETFKGPSNLNVGSPWYAAPEQEANPDAADFAADLYSVGVILYRMLTGRLPMHPLESVMKTNPDLDRSWDDFLVKSMAGNAEERFDSAKAMSNALGVLDSAWKEKIERICRLPESEPKTDRGASSIRAGTGEIKLRNLRLKVDPRQARKTFCADPLWRPRNYIDNRFEGVGPACVADRTTGLVWQRSGSEYPLNWHDAHAYIDRLNQNGFEGHRGWRLPTVDELMSLLVETPSAEDFCMEPIFDSAQKWLWSADRRSYTAAWFVSMDLGYISFQDFTCNFYVKAVCEA